MIELTERGKVIDKLKQGYFDKNLQQAKNDPCVIDAMIDWSIRQVKDIPIYNPWHTGIPTEDGLYAIYYYADGEYDYGFADWYDDFWDEHFSYDSIGCRVIAWQKIEPFEVSKKNE